MKDRKVKILKNEKCHEKLHRDETGWTLKDGQAERV